MIVWKFLNDIYWDKYAAIKNTVVVFRGQLNPEVMVEI